MLAITLLIAGLLVFPLLAQESAPFPPGANKQETVLPPPPVVPEFQIIPNLRSLDLQSAPKFQNAPKRLPFLPYKKFGRQFAAPGKFAPVPPRNCSVPLLNVTPKAKLFMPTFRPPAGFDKAMVIPPPAPPCEDERAEPKPANP
jgi:hypothetical protein